MNAIAYVLLTLALLASGSCAAAGSAPPEWGSRLALADVASRYGFSMQSGADDTVILDAPAARMVLTLNSRKLIFHDMLVWMNGPLLAHNGTLSLTDADAESVIDPLCRPATTLEALRIDTVVLDAGHGGHDPGALGRRVTEKKVALDLAHRVRRKLQAGQVRTLLTRSDDRFLTLRERVACTARWNASLFVSIHLNASSNPLARGIETFVLTAPGYPSTNGGSGSLQGYPGNRFDPASLLLATYVHKGLLTQSGASDRGIKRARFEVLRNAPCPAILLEAGFVSNSRDEALLLDPDYRDAVAEGIARGILTLVSRCQP
jgi:N-acetylmuramoyl-L-alanine amidase